MSKPRIGLIYAESNLGVMGANGALPWHLPEDLAHFKTITSGCTVVMGRKTWDSLPERFRPLPNRKNVVITRNANWSSPGAVVVHSIDEAIEKADGNVWVIGGSEILISAMYSADVIERTVIADFFSGDTFAPMLGDRWVRINPVSDDGWLMSKTGLVYRFETYKRPQFV